SFFKNLSYGTKEKADVEKAPFQYLKPFHQLKRVLDKNIKKDFIFTLPPEILDDIGYIFTVNKTDTAINSALKAKGIEQYIIDALSDLDSFAKFGHISVKACRMLIPFLEKGFTYDKACAEAGIDFKAHNDKGKSMFLSPASPDLEEIVNPVVRRAVSQTVKVVNAIIREQGHGPVYINIELARELSKSFDERKKIEKSMADNAEKNQRIVERLQNELGILYPTGMDIVKFKLWQEQDGVCPYSQTHMDIARLFEPGYVDIDHIIPYSICFDDSYNNKVLTLSSENRQKGNKIPMQYLSGKKKEDFQVWVNTSIKNSNKKQRLLKAELKDEDLNGFKSRNLNDTKYLSRVLYNYINDNLAFEDFANGGKKHVTAVNGAATSYIRKRWGIAKIREDGDLHHAVDAAVIACTTNGMIRRISEYSKRRETENTENSFPLPYSCFRKELEARTDNDAKQSVIDFKLPNYSEEDIENIRSCFVSRMPNHKVTGAAHLDTIRSGREKGFTISKVALSSLKLDKDGEIADYYNPDSDRLLYNALKSRLEQYNGDGKAAFLQDFVFRKPTSTGNPGPVVKKVKIIEKSTLNVPVRRGNGVAANGDMIRIDIFKPENDGYYFVPIYVSDTVKDKLPCLACRAGGQEWKMMNDDDFIFSLYPNDLIKVTSKKDIKLTVTNKDSSLQKEILRNNEMFYYCKAGISTASITIESHDGAYTVASLGIKSLLSLEKYTVDVLGNYYKVGKEKRMTFK
ncbi:MAG: type II CRISPR RNA-guided endonuclease Cas9, partial [Candidatus Fimenecus sp.]